MLQATKYGACATKYGAHATKSCGTCTREVRSRFFWTPAPVLTNQTPDPAPGQ